MTLDEFSQGRRFVVRAMVGLVAAGLVTASPAGVSQAEENSSSAMREVHLGVFPITEAAVPLLGLDQGIFAKHGLKLSVTTLANASISQSTVSGQVDIALDSLQHNTAAASAGLPLTVVSGLSVNAPGPSGRDPDGLLVLKSGPKRGADFNGATVAVAALNSADELATRVMIDKHGGDSRTLKFTVLPFPAMKVALMNGQVKVAALHDPFLSSFMETGEFAAPFGNHYFQAFADLPRHVFVTSKSYASSHQAEISAFHAAVRDSIAYAEAHPEAIPATLMKWFGTPAAVAQASVMPKLRGKVTAEHVVEIQRLFRQYNFTRSFVDPAAVVLPQ
ncbi:ABC transporter substrate-binding protein [Inquilinus limosus]|uniref:ABC transporter substrate-binding protein n=1 Tax=Inquilinus limosus TaxID=171674 RepID=UPI003F167C4A